MSGLAILCSGQGTLTPDMFDLLADAPEAAAVFQMAADVLGEDPRRLVRGGAIHGNREGQILCCTQAMAAWAVFGDMPRESLVVAGYSVGELAAWGVAGLLDARGVLDLAVARASVMDAATREAGGLVALGGLPRGKIDAICDRRAAHIAIVIGGDRFIVGGALAALHAVIADAEAAGAQRASLLQVAVASHTPLMAEAAEAFRSALEAATLPARMPIGVRLLSGIDAGLVHDIRDGARKLARQVGETIDWAGCLDACIAVGVETVLELGPGSALSRMMQEVAPSLKVRALADFRTIGGVRAWLAR